MGNNMEEIWNSIVRLAVKQARQITNDQEALTIKSLYKQWSRQIGRTLEVGEYIQHKDKLYRVLQQHTAQGNWVPGIGTESLYVVIDKDHEGTLADPIPWSTNMECFLGKYYIEDGILYECIRDSGIALHFKASELLDSYFNIYNKNNENNEGENDNENNETDSNKDNSGNNSGDNNENNNEDNKNDDTGNDNENNEGEDIEEPKEEEEPIEPEETEVGTLENPIDVTNATLPIAYEIDKYYKEGNVVYRCIRAETLHFLPSSLVGHYFEII